MLADCWDKLVWVNGGSFTIRSAVKAYRAVVQLVPKNRPMAPSLIYLARHLPDIKL